MGSAIKRSSYWDNVKAILIYLVVFAHFLIHLKNDTQSQLVQMLNLYIYVFHMPAFVMVSGYFSKKYAEKQIDVNRLIGLFLCFYCFKILIWISESIAHGHLNKFYVFSETAAPWYLLSLFWWYLLLPIFARLGKTKAIAVSVILMLLVGLDQNANSFLSMIRTINYLPFFVIGFYYSPVSEPGRRSRIAGALTLILLFAACYFCYDYINPYGGIVYGTDPFASLGLDCIKGLCFKTIWFAAALLLSFALFAVAPAGRHFFTRAGTYSLGIYIFHRIIRDFLLPLWQDGSILSRNGFTIILSAAIISLLVTALFSLKFFTDLVNLVLRREYVKSQQ